MYGNMAERYVGEKGIQEEWCGCEQKFVYHGKGCGAF